MKSTLRETDEKCADIVTDFLEKHFYCKTKEYQRITTKAEQVKGIDSTFILNDKKYLCDEKAAIRYVNKPLKTFSLELSFLNRKEEVQDGWLLDKSKVNNSYLFIWIDKGKKNILTEVDDIQSLEIALVDRDKILDYLKELKWTEEKLHLKMDFIRGNTDESLGNLYKNGCKFSYSQQLVEKPINVLIARQKLIEIADFSEKYETSNKKDN